MERPVVLQVQKLRRLFGSYPALGGISFDVRQGECLAIFGPNGAGKTTLIRILATAMRPTSGTATVDGRDLRREAEAVRRRIGVVSHQTFLYGSLTAWENLDFYGKLYDVPDRPARITEVLRRVGMLARAHGRVGTFSRGMQQRVAIARAVLHDPPILLLDEPEAGLDQEAASWVWDVLQGDTGRPRTVLLVTHDLERGLGLCHRLIILDRGREVFRAAAGELDITRLREVYHRVTGVAA